MKFKWFEKKVDERQERDIMQVEHIGFWAMYWMLVIAIFVQAFFVEDGGKHMTAEFIIFFVTSIIVLIGWMRKGVWSYHTRKVPGVKAYLVYSLIAMLAVGIPIGLLNGYRWKMEWRAILSSMAIMMASIFVISFVGFCVLGTMTRKRERELAEQTYEEDDEEDEEDL